MQNLRHIYLKWKMRKTLNDIARTALSLAKEPDNAKKAAKLSKLLSAKHLKAINRLMSDITIPKE